MAEDEIGFPFEVAVPGTPLSLAAKNKAHKAAWMQHVKHAAMERRNELHPMVYLDERPLAATLYYFPVAPMDGDVDNIVKPILDALKAVLYPDDRLIERVLVQKFEPQIERIFLDPTAELAAVLDMEPPVVYIRLDDDLAWRAVQ